jgi:serine/threonine protein kinase
MSQGTTADVAAGTEVEVYHKQFRTWVGAVVMETSEDGESLRVEGADIGSDWVAVNDGRVRLFKRKEKVVKEAAPQKYAKFVPQGCDVEFEVWDRYEQPKFVGQGAYGCVIQAYDKVSKQPVAVKKVIDIQEMDNIDAMRTLREMKICRHMIGHENIVKLLEIVPPTTCNENINEVYMIFEWMAGDLSKFIRSGALQDTHVMGFTYQIIAALKYIHSAGIMHRDMKPSNILVNPKGDIKLADFGLAIGAAGQSHQLINYVVTRWYRAPELLLDQKNYGPAIDMWSTGCILGEMLARRPLFRGNSSKDQLRLILSLIGKPKPDDVEFVDKPRYKEMLLKMQEKAAIPWSKIFHKAQPEVLDLLDKLLQFSPDKRIDATDSLSHPYFASLHNPQYEPDCKEKFGYVTEDLDVKEIFRCLAAESVIPVDPHDE